MDILAKLFGGQARVRIMRLFVLNRENNFEIKDIISRTRITRSNVRKELNSLLAMGFIKQKTITKEGRRGAKKKVPAWSIDSSFQYAKQIKEILIDPALLVQENLVDKFRPAGKIKLMIVSGVFIGSPKSRADLLLVGDKLKKNILQQVIKGLEAEIGKELNYVVFDSEEFKYRMDMYDKLVCDIIELPHEKLIDTNQLSTYISKK
jgi:hypothetical protein